ncbi:MAG: MATE family efflux transporter [Oscillospiraceae bacterium]
MAQAAGGMRNMTEGNCAKNILLFALPMLAGSLLQQLYNLVDSWVVGNYVGDSALAAVGVAYPVLFLFVSLFMGIGTGSTVVISQFFGAGKMDRVRDAVDTAYATFLITVIPLTVLALLLVEPLLLLLRIDESAFHDAKIYMTIVCAGLIGNVGYNTNAGILQGLGNSRTPLLFLAVATVLNIILDLVTVIVLHMGVAGVACATIFAQAVSWLFGIFYINRKYPEIRIRPRHWHIDRALLQEIVRIGLPAGIQSATISLGMMAVMGRVNTYGEAYTAAYNVGHKMDNLAFLPVQALASAGTAFVGQNMGASKPQRVKEGTKAAIAMAIVWCVIVNAGMLPIRKWLIALFSDTPAVVEAGAQYLLCLLPFYPFFAVMFCLNSIMRGAGESVVPMLIAFVGQIVFRVPAVYLLAHFFGPDYMYLGFGIGWIAASAIAVAYYASGRWKRHGSMAARAA